MKLKIIILLFVVLSGCSAKVSSKLDYNITEPLRVAVLPFAEVDSDGKFVDFESGLLIDNISVVSQDLGEAPRSLVRKLIQSELDGTALDMLAPWVVNSKLQHAGFADEQVDFIYPRLFSATAADLCNRLLDCDAVLRGRIKRWNRSYYGVQSVASVEIELELISARDEKVLYSAQGEDSEHRGLSKIPTGFSSLFIEPIRGLDNDIIVQLAQRLVKKMIDPLKVSNRPLMVNSVPPAVGAVAHSAVDGQLQMRDSLVVMAIGTSGKIGSFSIGEQIVNIPMVESSEKHYVGEFFPLPSDNFLSEPITVSLSDSFGRTVSATANTTVTLK